MIQLSKKGSLEESIAVTFTTASLTYVDATNLTVTITTNGNPVFVGLVGTSGISYLGNDNSLGNTFIQILEDSTVISQSLFQEVRYVPASVVSHLYQPPAGTYVFKVQMKTTNASYLARVNGTKLVAYELA